MPLTVAVNVALWKIGRFNQFVEQQTDFNTLHADEILDVTLPDARRQVLATAAADISYRLHRHGIGDDGWYVDLMAAIDKELVRLRGMKRRHLRFQ